MTSLALGENTFWEDVFCATAKGWQSIRRESDPGSKDRMADLRLRVYLVNAHTGWVSAMLTHVSDLHHAHKLVTKNEDEREQAQQRSIGKILQASNPRAAGDAALQREAFDAGLVNLAGTATYNHIIESNQEGLAGHWLLIVYKLSDGSHITRPKFWTTPNDTQPLLTPQELQVQVSTAARLDHQARETGIGRRIAQGGGLLLHPQYA